MEDNFDIKAAGLKIAESLGEDTSDPQVQADVDKQIDQLRAATPGKSDQERFKMFMDHLPQVASQMHTSVQDPQAQDAIKAKTDALMSSMSSITPELYQAKQQEQIGKLKDIEQSRLWSQVMAGAGGNVDAAKFLEPTFAAQKERANLETTGGLQQQQAFTSNQLAEQRAAAGEQRATTKFGMEMSEAQRKQKLAERENDPNSPESELARSLAVKMAPSIADKIAGVSATRMKELLPSITKMYDIEQKRLERQDILAEKSKVDAEKLSTKEDADREKRIAALDKIDYSSKAVKDFNPRTYDTAIRRLQETDAKLERAEQILKSGVLPKTGMVVGNPATTLLRQVVPGLDAKDVNDLNQVFGEQWITIFKSLKEDGKGTGLGSLSNIEGARLATTLGGMSKDVQFNLQDIAERRRSIANVITESQAERDLVEQKRSEIRGRAGLPAQNTPDTTPPTTSSANDPFAQYKRK